MLSAVGGWNLVPPTVLREGPLGSGSVQLWIDAAEGGTRTLIDVVTPAELVPGCGSLALIAKGNDIAQVIQRWMTKTYFTANL